MVANLSSHKRGWDARWKEFALWAENGTVIQKRLLELVDEDTEAFNAIMKAFDLPKNSEEEKAKRAAAVEEATKNASLVPLTVMRETLKVFELLEEMVRSGNPNSVTDAAVGALAARACIRGAYLNVRINVSTIKDKAYRDRLVNEGKDIDSKAADYERNILMMADLKISC
jgi:glutamate formiminotransferase/formiminotetrahydrofolate cyclodeaminase